MTTPEEMENFIVDVFRKTGVLSNLTVFMMDSAAKTAVQLGIARGIVTDLVHAVALIPVKDDPERDVDWASVTNCGLEVKTGMLRTNSIMEITCPNCMPKDS